MDDRAGRGEPRLRRLGHDARRRFLRGVHRRSGPGGRCAGRTLSSSDSRSTASERNITSAGGFAHVTREKVKRPASRTDTTPEMSAHELKDLLDQVPDTRELVLHRISSDWELYTAWSDAHEEAEAAYREWRLRAVAPSTRPTGPRRTARTRPRTLSPTPRAESAALSWPLHEDVPRRAPARPRPARGCRRPRAGRRRRLVRHGRRGLLAARPAGGARQFGGRRARRRQCPGRRTAGRRLGARRGGQPRARRRPLPRRRQARPRLRRQRLRRGPARPGRRTLVGRHRRARAARRRRDRRRQRDGRRRTHRPPARPLRAGRPSPVVVPAADRRDRRHRGARGVAGPDAAGCSSSAAPAPSPSSPASTPRPERSTRPSPSVAT